MSSGYSGTPLVKKLGIKPGNKVMFINEPDHYLGLVGDLQDDVRSLGMELGLVDIKVCAVDEDWSGLKFVYRKEDQ